MAAVAAPCGSETPPKLQDGLRAHIASKRTEAALLRERLRSARLSAQQARLHLQALGVADPGLVPSSVRAGSGIPEPPQLSEFRSLLQWLAESVDLTHRVVFDCGGEVLVGGRRVLLQRMAAWQLLGCGAPEGTGTCGNSRLKLSVPLDLQEEIAGLLTAARARGNVDEAVVQRLADSWEAVGTEVVSAAMGCPEPAIFLVHRETARAITVTRWPSVEFACGGPGGAFDPERHFARLAAGPPEPAMPHKAQLPPPTPGPEPALGVAPGPGPAQEEAVPPPPPPPPGPVALSVATDERVEVECDGQWLDGVLERVEGGSASAKCDAASPGAAAAARLAGARPARSAQEVAPKKLPRHMRARSIG